MRNTLRICDEYLLRKPILQSFQLVVIAEL
jgi:hypothetical protein